MNDESALPLGDPELARRGLKPIPVEQLALYASTLEEVLPPDMKFVLVLCGPQYCGAVATCPPEMADSLKAAMAELSGREVQFNN